MKEIFFDFLPFLLIPCAGFYIINAYLLYDDFDSPADFFSSLFEFSICDTVGELLLMILIDTFIFLHFPLILFFTLVHWFFSLPLHKEGGERK